MARSFPQHRFVAPAGSSHLVLVRHGESQAFVDGQRFPTIADGTGDPPLAPEGHVGAQQVAERLSQLDESIAAIYVTPLQRTQQTAAPLAAGLGLTPRIVADLQEVYLGEWDGGRSRQMFAEQHPIAMRVRAEHRWDVIPGAEPSEQFTARVRRGIDTIAQSHRDELAVVVTHGGVIGEIVHQATGAKRFSMTVDNASITHLIVAPPEDEGGVNRWLVRSVNDVSHRWSNFGSASSDGVGATET